MASRAKEMHHSIGLPHTSKSLLDSTGLFLFVLVLSSKRVYVSMHFPSKEKKKPFTNIFRIFVSLFQTWEESWKRHWH